MPPVRIADANDPRLADYRDLKRGARAPETFVAEGRLIVRRLLGGSRFRARSVLATERALAEVADVVPEDVAVYVAPGELIRRVVGFPFHRGCLAIGERGPDVPLDALLGGRRLVVLERLANPDNVGGVFRSAMAFGVDGVLLSPGCADPLYRRTVRVAMGGTLRVPFAPLPAWPDELGRLRDAGYLVIALTPDGGTDVAELGVTLPVPARFALVLGAEGDGVGAATREAAHLTVAIRMASGDHSLNVATAAGIALHRLVRR
jgi:tRNA G18 (ribose-2'-O)-methylase SpoU